MQEHTLIVMSVGKNMNERKMKEKMKETHGKYI